MYEIGPFVYRFKKRVDDEKFGRKIFCNQKIEILDREFVVITGPSGAGKSSLLQILKGIIPEFSNGDLSGHIVCKNNFKQVLFLFQNPYSQLIYPKAKEEFFFTMENYNYTHEQMDKKYEELKEVFNLDSLMEKETKELSHGECQRLVFASLMAVDPDVILLDEPTAFLDSDSRRDFYNWLRKVKGTKTIVVVDHHLDEVLPLADKVIWVNKEGEVSLGIKSLMRNANISSKLNVLKNSKPDIEMKLNHIFFHYPGQKTLLKDISLSIKSGEVIVIRGSNGKGKSTLLKIMAGILKPLKGEVQISKDQKELNSKKHYKEIGFVFQNPESHFFYDTIDEELKNVGDKKLFDEFINMFLSGVNFSRSPFLLSEGEKRRLSILMTVFLDKGIVFFDEPTFGQDFESIEFIKEIILWLKNLGKIQFIISHDDKFIDSLPASVYQLENESLVRLK